MVDGIDDGDAHAVGLQLGDARADRSFARGDGAWSIRPTVPLRLRLQHAHEVGVGHRRERMMRMPARTEQHVTDEQVALKTVRPFSGKAGQAMVKSRPSASISASATGPMLPAGVLSKVEQYLK